MAWKRVGKWEGGYVREDENGRRVYVIEKWWGGSRHHVSTRCSSERAAYKEMERFELDPDNYRPRDGQPGTVAMTADLILEYRAYQSAKGISGEWVDEVARCLKQWMLAVGKRDLRALDLHRDIRPALATWTTRIPHRIKSLKGFMRWLRAEKGLIKHDSTADLRVPQAKPEKWTRRKVVPHEDVAAVLKHLPEVTRDVLHLLTATAMHLSEVRRFAEGGELIAPIQGEGVLSILVVRHKSGALHKASLSFPEHVAAAERLRARGALPKRMTLARHMIAACKAAGVPWFGLGQMRHSVLTWGVERGATIQDASEFAGHKSKTTTERHYVDLAVPKVIPILRLLP